MPHAQNLASATPLAPPRAKSLGRAALPSTCRPPRCAETAAIVDAACRQTSNEVVAVWCDCDESIIREIRQGERDLTLTRLWKAPPSVLEGMGVALLIRANERRGEIPSVRAGRAVQAIVTLVGPGLVRAVWEGLGEVVRSVEAVDVEGVASGSEP